ncbi:MAG: amidohydrolase family protein [Nitrososphaerales archaeon]
MKSIDIHAHIYPQIYFDILDSCGHIRKEENGDTFILETGTDSGHRIKPFEDMWNIEQRLKIMDSIGVDIQILSIGNPWVSYIPKTKCKDAARALNSELARISKEYPKRFFAMGVIPYSSMTDAIEEIDYAVDELGLKGFMIGTHFLGKPIFSNDFLPCYEEIQRKDVPMFIHPLAKQDASSTYDRLMTVGLLFPNETTIAATGFMISGFLDRLPNLKIILAHLGGNIPISIGRIERVVKTNPTNAPLQRATADYLKRFYLDSVIYFGPALEYAVDIWGPDKIMLGSDFPWHWSKDYEKIIAPLSNSKYSSSVKDMIYGENAMKIFKL